MDRGLSQYLRCYAEPEAKIAEELKEHFSVALVVPLHRENASCLEGYLGALRRCSPLPLLVLVVNSTVDASAAAQSETEVLLSELVAITEATELNGVREPDLVARFYLGSVQGVAVVIVDRCSAGRRLPKKTGAGLARKIGNDIAVRLKERGQLDSRLVFQTDGDATLPEDFFAALTHIEPSAAPAKSAASAWVIPFVHEEGKVPEEYVATLHYEIRLRYHLFGLKFADSSFAWHSIGSAMALEIYHYAAVRGFPQRPAGEDFYLLNKLSKLGEIRCYPSAPVRIRARRSDRVPFGTGPAVQQLLEHESELHDFRIFGVLKRCNRALSGFAAGAEVGDLRQFFVEQDGLPQAQAAIVEREWQATQAAWEQLRVGPGLERAVRGARAGAIRGRRVRDRFDALTTLRFLHAVRDRLYPDVPWREALGSLPVQALRAVDGEAELATLERVRRGFLAVERA